ncbi:MAG: UDP-N-acetylmuramoyl-L-alanyl-D-glutamate--2,6-diaminopimelate ligase [Deltaproteobacteria bacterium]|nr:UDP-N-acetylmuramoyl-L-alanyl-D-glutamate--2,6-diaminopimelate ligase [Deltaproteobacteria bacterium]
MSVTMTGLEYLVPLAGDRAASISTHSGKAGKGDIFVSLPKAAPLRPGGPDYTGAAAYLADAVRAGVSYVVCTRAVFDAVRVREIAPGAIGVALVEDTRAALGELAAAYYGTGRSKVAIVGITGTNGKTTSAYLLEAVAKAAGKTPGVIGTVEYRWPGHEEASPLTTPDCLALHSMVASMQGAGADIALMEVSSHAIDQNRIAGLAFAGALFTNLSQDHLDYHRDMEDYFATKARLFTGRENGGLAAPGAALAVYVDDPYGERLFAANDAILGFSLKRGGERIVQGTILEQGRDGLRLQMAYGGDAWDLHSPLVGEFNAANLMGAQAMSLALGFGRSALRALETFSGVPGRLERIANPCGLSVFVDYAHTPDALQKALQALRGAKFERVVTVFGCGGNRDRTKRPLMGEAAAALSDVVVLTSDNPRREEPLAIMADVRPGLAGARRVIEEADRKKAIAAALDIVKPGDALLIAGKGHEPYQIIGDTRYPFSDQRVVRELLGCT